MCDNVLPNALCLTTSALTPIQPPMDQYNFCSQPVYLATTLSLLELTKEYIYLFRANNTFFKYSITKIDKKVTKPVPFKMTLKV